MTVITWANLTAQEQADYVIGILFAFHPTRERTAESAMIDIGIADGEAARDSDMHIDNHAADIRDAPSIWRTCRANGIGAAPAMLERLKRVDE